MSGLVGNPEDRFSHNKAHFQLSNTDTHMVKAELEKKLKEKEDVEQNQAQLIQHLQKMIVISGVEDRGSASEVSRKRRRETWCPGKAARGLNKG